MVLTRRFAVVFILTGLLTGCGAGSGKKVPLAKGTTTRPGPVLPTAAAVVVPADISSELPPAPVPPDEVGAVIADARRRFDRGTELYDTGFLKQAKTEFDSAMDTLLNSSRTFPKNERIRKELNDLVARVHEMELTAIRNGDGFTDQDGQRYHKTFKLQRERPGSVLF